MRNKLLLAVAVFTLLVMNAASCGEEQAPPPPPGVGIDSGSQQTTPPQGKQPPTQQGTSENEPSACAPRQSLAPLVTKLQPSVVNIYSTKLKATWNPLAPFLNIPPQGVTKERSLGSGFIFNACEYCSMASAVRPCP